MAAFFYYASFPNSRIKPRPSTTRAQTEQVSINDIATPPYVKVVAADLARTYMLLENFDAQRSFYYVYTNDIAVNPTLVATFGVTGEMRFFTGTGTLFQKQDEGTTVNWLAVAIEDVGEKVLPLQTASLDAPQDVRAAVEAGAAIIVGVDKGVG